MSREYSDAPVKGKEELPRETQPRIYTVKKPTELTFKTDESRILKTLDCFD